jgi:hypothetical protein
MRGESLMPCSPRKARLLRKQKKANIIDYKPFTIQLLYATGETTQKVDMGIDLGLKQIGLAVTSAYIKDIEDNYITITRKNLQTGQFQAYQVCRTSKQLAIHLPPIPLKELEEGDFLPKYVKIPPV